MEYGDFYDIAVYGNTVWNGSYTSKEIAQNAYDYYSEFQWSKENKKVSNIMQELIQLLIKDGNSECREWLYLIKKELYEEEHVDE